MDVRSIEGPVFVDRKEKQIREHLAMIDSVLEPFAPQLAKPPFKDLSNPKEFVTGEDVLEPKDLVLVHLTDMFPENGVIHPTAFYDPDSVRFTIHTTVNCLAPDISNTPWKWDKRKYAVLIPFDKVMTRVLAFNPADTFFLDDLELPEGTVILKDKHDQTPIGSSGKAQVVDADYSHPGKRLSGFQRTVYEQMIARGYFPQGVSERGDWFSWGSYTLPNGTSYYGREIWRAFCKQYGLEFASGNPHDSHWSGQLENFALYYAFYKNDGDELNAQEIAEQAKIFLETNEIPEKYKEALQKIINQA